MDFSELFYGLSKITFKHFHTDTFILIKENEKLSTDLFLKIITFKISNFKFKRSIIIN